MAAPKKGGLGKGLGALFSDSTQEMIENQLLNSSEKTNENSILYIDINKITPNRKQPRKIFDDSSLEELAESIKIHGVIQPIIVKSLKNGYEIIAGERRWRASRLAGLKEMPCIIRSFSDKDNLLVALIENLQREDLNPMDESSAYFYMIENFGLTQEEVAFYDALTKPQAIKDFYTNEQLVAMTRELTETLRKNRTIDWQKKEMARAKMRKMVKHLLKKYDYPPENYEDAIATVIGQCEMWTDN